MPDSSSAGLTLWIVNEIECIFDPVSDTGIEWLAEALSNWLNIPIAQLRKEADSR